MRRQHFIGNFGEEAPFYWLFQRGGAILLGKFGRRLVEFFDLCPKLCWRLAGVSFLWSMLNLEGWSSRSSYFIGVALMNDSFCIINSNRTPLTEEVALAPSYIQKVSKMT